MDAKQLLLMLNRCGEPMRSLLRSHIDALVADNAAMFQHLRNANDPHRIVACGIAGCICGILAVMSSPHPGVALLSEMEALRKEREDLRSQLAEWETRHNDRARERDEARAQVATARVAALEEAKTLLMRQGPYYAQQSRHWAKEIDTLATTPPPPVVPVAKVREVLNKASATLARQGYGSGIIRDIANGLGVDLGGEP